MCLLTTHQAIKSLFAGPGDNSFGDYGLLNTWRTSVFWCVAAFRGFSHFHASSSEPRACVASNVQEASRASARCGTGTRSGKVSTVLTHGDNVRVQSGRQITKTQKRDPDTMCVEHAGSKCTTFDTTTTTTPAREQREMLLLRKMLPPPLPLSDLSTYNCGNYAVRIALCVAAVLRRKRERDVALLCRRPTPINALLISSLSHSLVFSHGCIHLHIHERE